MVRREGRAGWVDLRAEWADLRVGLADRAALREDLEVAVDRGVVQGDLVDREADRVVSADLAAD